MFIASEGATAQDGPRVRIFDRAAFTRCASFRFASAVAAVFAVRGTTAVQLPYLSLIHI